MHNLPIEETLKCISDRLSSARWLKWRSVHNLHGNFVAVACVAAGFSIEFTEHDYRQSGDDSGTVGRIYGRVYGRRHKLRPRIDKHWIELTISDNFGRFGRKSILDNLIMLPDSKEFAMAEKMFRKIEEVATEVTSCDRLSVPQSLAGFCSELKT